MRTATASTNRERDFSFFFFFSFFFWEEFKREYELICIAPVLSAETDSETRGDVFAVQEKSVRRRQCHERSIVLFSLFFSLSFCVFLVFVHPSHILSWTSFRFKMGLISLVLRRRHTLSEEDWPSVPPERECGYTT